MGETSWPRPAFIPSMTWPLIEATADPKLNLDLLPENRKTALANRIREMATNEGKEDLAESKTIARAIYNDRLRQPVHGTHYELYYLEGGESLVKTYDDLSHAYRAADSMLSYNKITNDQSKVVTICGIFEVITRVRRVIQ